MQEKTSVFLEVIVLVIVRKQNHTTVCTILNGYKMVIKKEKLPTDNLLKGKAVPLQAWSGPEGSRKLRFPDYTTTQDGDKVVSLTHRPPLPAGNAPGTYLS